MSESAMHHAEHGAADPMSRRVGVMVAMLGILLAVVTISAPIHFGCELSPA